MTGYDFDRPYIDAAMLPLFTAVDRDEAARFGRTVKAISMSNSEYAARHARMARSNNMKEPPSYGRKFPGYLLVRKLGQPDQYETWIPDHAFEEIYEPVV